jgi:N-acetyltransferase
LVISPTFTLAISLLQFKRIKIIGTAMFKTLEEAMIETANVKLVPLQTSHRDALLAASADGELWNLWYTSVPSEKTVDEYIDTALANRARQDSFPFVVVDKASEQVIGSTRFCNADHQNRRLEIGYTWYAKRFQRSAVNTQCKLALLEYAFETYQAIAVELRTHSHNRQSQAAITRLGAKQDGILRNHQKMADGLCRDTVVFSITDYEWPLVKKSLTFKLAR